MGDATGEVGDTALQPISVTVIGGYLGAGKTTLVNCILADRATQVSEHGEQDVTVVLVNDFGSVNIDQDLIVAADDRTITLQNGCICCSLADGLTAALDDVLSMVPRPTHLVIEASGVSDPAVIARTAHGGSLRVDAVVTVVDAETVRVKARDRYVGDVVQRQITVADVIVLNKVDLVEDDACNQTRAWLATMSGGASIIDAVHGSVPVEVLVGDSGDLSRWSTGGSTGMHADERFVSDSIAWPDPVDVDQVVKRIRDLPSSVVRVKGVLRSLTDRRVVVHRVGARLAVSDDGPWVDGSSRMVVIAVRGQGGDVLLLDSWRDLGAP